MIECLTFIIAVLSIYIGITAFIHDIGGWDEFISIFKNGDDNDERNN